MSKTLKKLLTYIFQSAIIIELTAKSTFNRVKRSEKKIKKLLTKQNVCDNIDELLADSDGTLITEQ